MMRRLTRRVAHSDAPAEKRQPKATLGASSSARPVTTSWRSGGKTKVCVGFVTRPSRGPSRHRARANAAGRAPPAACALPELRRRPARQARCPDDTRRAAVSRVASPAGVHSLPPKGAARGGRRSMTWGPPCVHLGHALLDCGRAPSWRFGGSSFRRRTPRAPLSALRGCCQRPRCWTPNPSRRWKTRMRRRGSALDSDLECQN